MNHLYKQIIFLSTKNGYMLLPDTINESWKYISWVVIGDERGARAVLMAQILAPWLGGTNNHSAQTWTPVLWVLILLTPINTNVLENNGEPVNIEPMVQTIKRDSWMVWLDFFWATVHNSTLDPGCGSFPSCSDCISHLQNVRSWGYPHWQSQFAVFKTPSFWWHCFL